MDKMLGESPVKRRTLRWPLAFFDNMIDVTGMACYVIYSEYNARFEGKRSTKKVTERIANMLCMPSMEARSNNRMLMRDHFLRGVVEIVLGRQIVTPRENAAVSRAPHGSRGPTPIVGSCCVCRRGNNKKPGKPKWFAGSLYATNIQYLK